MYQSKLKSTVDLLVGDNFNDYYQVEVDKYLKKLEDSGRLKWITMPNGSRVTLYVIEYEGTICLSKSKKYRIPDEIKALLSFQGEKELELIFKESYPFPEHILRKISKNIYNLKIEDEIIQKPHAYGLKLGLSTDLHWDELRIREINNVPFEDLNEDYCNECNQCKKEMNTFEDYRGKWYIFSEEYGDIRYEICPDCYEKEQFEEYSKDQYHFFHLGEYNFLDWIEFMTEPDLDSSASGSTFYVNCNPESKYYGQIMVTICDNHGRQAFHIHYECLEKLLDDIKKWIKLIPSRFNEVFGNDVELEDFYKKDFYDCLEFEETDLDFDKRLEVEKDRKRYEEFLDKGFGRWNQQSLMEKAIEYSLLKEGEDEKLTKRFVLDHRDDLKTLTSEEKAKKIEERIEEIKTYREKAILQRKSNEHYKKTGKFLPNINSNGVLGCDHYADLSEDEIPTEAQKQIEKLLTEPIFEQYKISSIEKELRELGVYKHDCFKSFTMWHRCRDNLGFYWG